MRQVTRSSFSASFSLKTSRRFHNTLQTDGRRMALESLEPRDLLSGAGLTNQLLVQFRPDVSEAAKELVRGGAALVLRERLAPADATRGELDVLRLSPGASIDAALRKLKSDSQVAFAEVDYVVTNQAVSNDPYYTSGQLWGMYGDQSAPANNYGSQAAETWATGNTGSSSVLVGIIDEGIDFNHPDLQANVWTNPYEIAGNGVDDDGNGYVDDIHGWDFYNNDNTVYDAGADQHGTHVAGTIGATGGNGAGVAGVNWNVGMISAKFLGPSGGYISDAVRALDYLTDLKTRHGLNIVATNNSWGGGGFSQTMLDAITRAAKAGILFVAAAGNGGSDGVGDNNDAVANYPSNYDTTASAGYDSVIAVAAINSSGAKASFSNYGAATVDLGAPGVSIVSTLPGNTYGSYSGTSMATPHVTGAAALYAASHPGASAQTIKKALLDSARATPTTSLAGITSTGGRLNVSAMPSYLPAVSINDVSKVEGNSGVTAFTFTVSLSTPATDVVTVNYATADGTATVANNDYTAAAGAVSFAPGVTSQTITVNVNGDAVTESNETFLVNLSGVTANATLADAQGVGTIQNDDVSLPTLSINDVSVLEGNLNSTKATFTVRLSAASTQTVTVRYATVNGTATAGSDYKAASGTLTFRPGQTSQTITIAVYGDKIAELDETFLVVLSSPANATLAVSQGVGTIRNDDGALAAAAAARAAAVDQLLADGSIKRKLAIDLQPAMSGDHWEWLL